MIQENYYIAKTVKSNNFAEVVENVTAELKSEGFGVVAEINFKNTFKEKIGIDIPKYLVLGACNPPFAYRSVLSEQRIGLLLPCNVLIREIEDDKIEVSVVDPMSTMQSVENSELLDVAKEIKEKLKRVVSNV